MRTIALFVPSAILTLCALAIACVSGFLNFEGAVYMIPGAAGTVVGLAAIFGELAKTFWLTAFHRAISLRLYGAAAGAVILAVLLTAVSLIFAMGVSSSNRAEAIDAKTDMQSTKSRAEAALSDAQARVTASRGRRASGEVEKDLTKAQADVRKASERETAERTSTCGKRCEEAIAAGTAAQAKADAFEAEHTLSLQAEQAQADLTTARNALDGIKAPSSRDPQADAIASMLPIEPRLVSKWLPMLPSLLVEFGPSLMLLMAMVLAPMQPRNLPVKVETVIPTVLTLEPVSREKQALSQVRAMMLVSPNTSQRKLAATLDIPKSTLSDWMKRWEKDGQLTARPDVPKTALIPYKAA